MEVTVLGCRGSTPVSGPEFDRFGGDTSSVAVARTGEGPELVLDAGTGLRNIGRLLGEEPFRGSILLTHLHWDHTHGLPFTPSLDRADAEVDLYIPAQGGDPLEVLSRAIGPPHFPITPASFHGRWRFHAIEAGHHEIAGFEVLATDVCHKGGRTFGYRVTDGESALGYIPDYWLAEATTEPTELVAGVDLLVHDAQHLASEMESRAHLGHSSVEYVVDLAARHGVGQTVLFHHDPRRTDAELDQISSRFRGIQVASSTVGHGAVYVASDSLEARMTG